MLFIFHSLFCRLQHPVKRTQAPKKKAHFYVNRLSNRILITLILFYTETVNFYERCAIVVITECSFYHQLKKSQTTWMFRSKKFTNIVVLCERLKSPISLQPSQTQANSFNGILPADNFDCQIYYTPRGGGCLSSKICNIERWWWRRVSSGCPIERRRW